MLVVKLEIVLVNEPEPVPLLVLVVSDIVGLVLVLQQTPLAVTVLPPSFVIFPPLLPEVVVIDEILVVVKMGELLVKIETSLE